MQFQDVKRSTTTEQWSYNSYNRERVNIQHQVQVCVESNLRVLPFILVSSAIELHFISFLRSSLLPRVAELEPVLWVLYLPAILYLLREDPVLVAEAVAVACYSQCGHRVEEASCTQTT